MMTLSSVKPKPLYDATERQKVTKKYHIFHYFLMLVVFTSCWFVTGGTVQAAKQVNAASDIQASLKVARAKYVDDLKNITKRIALLEKNDSLSDVQISELTTLKQTHDFIQKSIDSVDRTREYINASLGIPARLISMEEELATPLPDSGASIDKTLPLESLEAQLEAARAELELKRQMRKELDAEVAQRAERQQKILKESTVASKRLEKIKQLQAAPSENVDDNLKNKRAAEQAQLEELIQELEQESRSYDNQRELLRAQRQLSERRVLVAERYFNDLELTVNRLRTADAAKTMRAADEASLAAVSAHPLIRNIADENKQFAAELAEISTSTTMLSQEKQHLDEMLGTTQRRFESIKEKISQIGLIDAVGFKLRSDRNQLPDSDRYVASLKAHHAEINQVQLRRIEIEDRLFELVDLEQEAKRRVRTSKDKLTDVEQTALVLALTDALRKQKETYLNELISAYDTYFEKSLYPFLEDERNLINLVDEYRIFIDARILWIQSAPPVRLESIRQLGASFDWFFSGNSWLKVAVGLKDDFQKNPLPVIFSLFMVVVLFTSQWRLKQKLSSLGRYVTKLSKAKFIDTIWAGFVTMLITLPGPLLLYIIAWRLAHVAVDSTFSAALSAGLFSMAYLLFAGLFLRRLCRQDGLGEAHFRWKTESMTLIRRQLNWFLPAALPLVFVIAMTLNQPTQAYHDSLGRLAFFVLMAITTLLIYRLMHPVRGLSKLMIESDANSWLNRLSGIWFPALLLTPFGLAVAAALGYLYTAVQLELHIVSTVFLLFAVIVVKSFFIRWLSIVQRKLALEQWRKKSVAQLESQEDAKPHGGEVAELTIPDEPEIDIAAINSQTMRLLNSAIWISVVIGIAIIWVEILPAFNMLNEVVLWGSEVTSTESGTSITTNTSITLADFLLAAIILLMTFLISQNIPGLLEIAILQRLPFTPGGRYAITSIVRYILVIIGLAMTFNAIGIGWSKVQWLAAAITVGLGFGLQEIFANFVSGLIILFERPIRVGDSVTVGNVSGKVSRIQMRATMITDWDRKELIIPNKEFVTGQVINWSLTDTILRLVIPIGIAYGSDTKLAQRVLLAVAAAYPNVLKDPEPVVRYCSFGESSLDFELRAFIPHPDLLPEVRHDLLMEIDQRFRKANIEIAFPQRDIHIRDATHEGTTPVDLIKGGA